MPLADRFAPVADAILDRAVAGDIAVPGVVAMLTNRSQTLYAGSAGRRDLTTTAPMATDSVLAIYSCTKAVTATAVMQLVESGAIALDEPARRYVPEIGDIPILAGFDAAGTPSLRAPESDLTIAHLLLHTAGFGYDMFNADLGRFVASRNGTQGRMAALMSVRLFEAGARWEYGVSLDWAGKVVEAVYGERLDTVMRRRIFEPLDMHDTGYTLTPSMRERWAATHQREADGSLTVLPFAEPPHSPKAQTGGSGLFSTAEDYLRFIRMILDDGAAQSGVRVLQPRTVARMTANSLAPLAMRALPGAMPRLTNPVDIFPDTPKSWGYSWMINDETAATGRPGGTVGWAGLPNLYYWIDRRTGIGGFWGTQVLPFIDPGSFGGFTAFETAVYAHEIA